MNQEREKTCSTEKKLSGRFGFFSNFRGGLTKKCVCGGGGGGEGWGGVDQHSFCGG